MKKRLFFSLLAFVALMGLSFASRAQCPPGSRVCLMTVYCDDMVGDGWNGAALEVWQDTVLRGSVTLSSGYSGEVEVPVCTNDTVRFVWRSGPLDYEISFSVENGDGSMILSDIMAGDFSNGTIVALAMPACPDCVHPINLSCAPDTTSAYVSWTAVGNEHDWVVYLNGVRYTMVGTNGCFISGLSVNTDYTVGVRSLCGSSDTSDMVQLSFHTPCPPLRISYFNSFSTETLDEAPMCWNLVIPFGDAPKVFDEASYSDSLSLFFAAAGSNVITTPLVPLPGNEIKVTFQARLEFGINIGPINLFNSSLRAGVMTNLADTSSFVPLVSITDMDNTWHEYEFSTSELSPDSAYYVAFFFKGSDMLIGNGFVDDVSIVRDNGCDRPNQAYVDSVGARCAALRWSGVGGNSTGYYLYYSPYNNSHTASEYGYVTDTAAVLRGLDQSTTYYAWVRTECGIDSSDYKVFPPFTTQMTCSPVSDVNLGSVGYTAAVLSWQYDALNGFPSEGAWVQVADHEDFGTVLIDTFSLGNTVLLTGLQPGHFYRAWVYSTCRLDNGYDTANAAVYDFMTQSCSEIAGDGSRSGNGYVVSTQLTHSYAQTLYPRSEMPAVDTIWGVAFRTSTGVAEPLTFSLYMANTSLPELSADNYVPHSAFSLVASNYTLPVSDAEWQVVRFDTPFVYDTTQNLAIAVHNASGHFYLNSTDWYYHPTAGVNTVTWSHLSPILLSSPSSLFGVSATRYAADVRFIAQCEADGCLPPVVSEVISDSTSVSLAWYGEGTSSLWVVQYATGMGYITAATVSTPYTSITGLTPATQYSVRVGSVCDSDTVWYNLTVTTGCGIVPVPYSENFDQYADGIMPPCWNYNSGVVQHRHGGLFWQQATTRQPAVLPAFNIPVNRLEINFKAMLESAYEGEAIVVGVTDDVCSYYEWLDTLSSPSQSLSAFEWFRYDFSQYQGDGTRIALAHLLPLSEATLIDDITVSETFGCMPPAGLTATHLRDADSIVVRWNGSDGVSRWEVAWDTVTQQFSSLSGWNITTDTFYSMPPLTMGGKYQFYVRAICIDGNNSQSAWRSITFVAGSVEMPFASASTVTGCGVVVYDNGGPSGDYQNSSASTLVVRPDDSTHVVAFRGGTVDLNVWGGDTLSIYEGEGTDGTLLYSINSTYGPEAVNVNLVSEVGPLTFRFTSNSYGAASGFELYTECVDAPACRRPRSVTATVLSSHEAHVSWIGDALAYDVSYRPLGTSAAWRTLGVSADSVTLYGLTAGGTYELFVKGYCPGNVFSPASAIITFSMQCDTYTIAPGLTVDESFEEGDAPARCFTLIQSDDNPNTMIHTNEKAFSGGRSFRFSSYLSSPDYNQYLVSPPLASADSISLRFRYSDMMYGQETLRVGYSLTGNSPDDFVWTDTLTTSGILWQRYQGSFPSGTRFVAINYCSQLRFYAYVDSLRISVVPSADCPAPTIVSVTESADSVTVEFDAYGTVEAYITSQPWNDNVNGVTVTGNRYTFRGLTPNTDYTIGLRSHCANGIGSHWTTRQVTTATNGCPPPQEFSLVEVHYTEAVFSWEGGSGPWELNVYGPDFNQSYEAEASPFTVTGLQQGVDYHARIRSLCNGLPGAWYEQVRYFTTTSCAVVNHLLSRVVDENSGVVELQWEGNGTSYVLEYGEEHYLPGEGITVSDIAVPHYRLEGLRPGVAYDYYVKAQCDENAFSLWSERGHFVVSMLDIKDADGDFAANLFPNPATGVTVLELSGVQGGVDVELVNLSGQTVLRRSAECNGDCRIQIELGKLPKGAYFVRLTGSRINAVKKLIVK